MPDLDFSGKVVLVTGSSRGIGAEMIKAFGRRGMIVDGDAFSRPGCENIVERTIHAFGWLDILISNNGAAPQLLRNDGGNANHWLEILLIGTKSNRDGVGARVKLTAGDLVLYDQRKGGMSYQSAQDPRLHFGLGGRTNIDSLEVIWPRGMTMKLANIKADQIIAIKEGKGIVERPFPRIRKAP